MAALAPMPIGLPDPPCGSRGDIDDLERKPFYEGGEFFGAVMDDCDQESLRQGPGRENQLRFILQDFPASYRIRFLQQDGHQG